MWPRELAVLAGHANQRVITPHPPLRSYYDHESDRRNWVRGVFNRTASDYDRLEALIGLGTGRWYRSKALRRAGLEPGMTVVDIGTGTGLMARAAADIVGDAVLVTGVDPSTGMLENAKVPAGVRLLEGSAESIPLDDCSADFLSMGYALRHISDLSASFAEFHRVLRPGGLVCLLEITLPQSRVSQAVLKAWLYRAVPRIATVAAATADAPLLMRYYWDTIAACVPPETILRALTGAGFVNVHRQIDLQIFSAYCARKPQIPDR
jgi:demethylmenaquinone methyltransferase/2-methoxy-6-polyprenyl-1,4-benzoquinol methylase